jgi:glutathione S-transferase
MYTLWYHSSCPLSRQLKSVLDHLSSDYQLIRSDYWRPNNQLFEMSPFGMVPLLKTKSIGVVDSMYAIIEYLIATYPHLHLFPKDLASLSEMRRLLSVINERFYIQVSRCIVREKFVRLMTGTGSPRREYLRSASTRQAQYLDYICLIIKERNFLVYDKMSFADIAFAGHMSILDYFGMIDWYKYPFLRSWYQIIKSLPYFRCILDERIGSFVPPDYYLELDF